LSLRSESYRGSPFNGIIRGKSEARRLGGRPKLLVYLAFAEHAAVIAAEFLARSLAFQFILTIPQSGIYLSTLDNIRSRFATQVSARLEFAARDLDAHMDPQLGVKVRQRLVEQEHLGCLTIARPIATRCRWPPDNSFGRRSSNDSSSRMRAASSTCRSISGLAMPA
jgi:hypothetical protein